MESIADLVVDELHRRRGLVKVELSKRYKRTKPFRKEPVSVEEQLVEYLSLTDEKAFQRIEAWGEDAFTEYQNTMEAELANRRG